MSSPTPENSANQFSEKPLPSVTPGTQPTNAPTQHDDELFNYIIDCLNQGSSKAEIRKQLIAAGYGASVADEAVENAAEWLQQNPSARSIQKYPDAPSIAGFSPATTGGGGGGGTTNMWVGGVICLIGIVITVGTCMAAGESGGRVTIAWGAIVFGAIQFFRGLSQQNQQ